MSTSEADSSMAPVDLTDEGDWTSSIDADSLEYAPVTEAIISDDATKVYSVRLPVTCIAELRALADERHIAPSTLMRQWVLERLDVEHGRGGGSVPAPTVDLDALADVVEIRLRRVLDERLDNQAVTEPAADFGDLIDFEKAAAVGPIDFMKRISAKKRSEQYIGVDEYLIDAVPAASTAKVDLFIMNTGKGTEQFVQSVQQLTTLGTFQKGALGATSGFFLKGLAAEQAQGAKSMFELFGLQVNEVETP